MKVSVIGAGNMGSGFVKQFAQAGHTVLVTAIDGEKAAAVAKAHGATAVDAKTAASADLIVLATAAGDAVTALQSLGDISGKTVIDITNPLTADYMGLTIGHSTSSAEEIVKAVPGIKLVKAFNTVFAQVLAGGASCRPVNRYKSLSPVTMRPRKPASPAWLPIWALRWWMPAV